MVSAVGQRLRRDRVNPGRLGAGWGEGKLYTKSGKMMDQGKSKWVAWR